MYSIIAFLLTFIEMGTALVSYGLQSQMVFYDVVVYGSPFYLMMTLFTSFSAVIDKNPLYLLFLLFHAIKYFVFFRAQLIDNSNLFRTTAIILEASYLALSGYYII